MFSAAEDAEDFSEFGNLLSYVTIEIQNINQDFPQSDILQASKWFLALVSGMFKPDVMLKNNKTQFNCNLANY